MRVFAGEVEADEEGDDEEDVEACVADEDDDWTPDELDDPAAADDDDESRADEDAGAEDDEASDPAVGAGVDGPVYDVLSAESVLVGAEMVSKTTLVAPPLAEDADAAADESSVELGAETTTKSVKPAMDVFWSDVTAIE